MNLIYRCNTGDTYRPITAVLRDEDGALVNIAAATAVAFSMQNESMVVKVSAAAGYVVSVSDSTIAYQQTGADMDTPGIYIGQFKLTYPTGVDTYPAEGYVEVRIQQSIVT